MKSKARANFEVVSNERVGWKRLWEGVLLARWTFLFSFRCGRTCKKVRVRRRWIFRLVHYGRVGVCYGHVHARPGAFRERPSLVDRARTARKTISSVRTIAASARCTLPACVLGARCPQWRARFLSTCCCCGLGARIFFVLGGSDADHVRPRPNSHRLFLIRVQSVVSVASY